jgi:ATP-dependent Lon protease
MIEHLAVLKCYDIINMFDRTPGVGKTSIGRSVAEALGREYVAFLGGGVMSLKLEGIENI